MVTVDQSLKWRSDNWLNLWAREGMIDMLLFWPLTCQLTLILSSHWLMLTFSVLLYCVLWIVIPSHLVSIWNLLAWLRHIRRAMLISMSSHCCIKPPSIFYLYLVLIESSNIYVQNVDWIFSLGKAFPLSLWKNPIKD